MAFLVMTWISVELTGPEHTKYYGPFATLEEAMAFGANQSAVNIPWGWEELHAPEY